jgi:cell division protein FtsX
VIPVVAGSSPVRHPVRFLAVAVLVLALAACGSSVKPLTAAQAKHCAVRVYFAPRATRAEEHAVAARLRGDSRVVRVTFVSKAQALARMSKEYPALTSVPGVQNPLPDAFLAVPDQLSDAGGIARSVHRLPGVANVLDGSPLVHLCSA